MATYAKKQPKQDTRRALITGITGQDGSYLAELLLSCGYEVHGVTRSTSRQPSGRDLGYCAHLAGQITLHRLNLRTSRLQEVIADIQPDELYHFAADSFIPNGWEYPVDNLDANLGLALNILEAIRRHSSHTKMLNACSREVFGNSVGVTADELTAMQPVTPYGINKAASRWTVNSFRDRYGIFAVNAILFNHESPRRGPHFVTRKITKRVAEIHLGLARTLELGNLQVRRDWGFAGDYVEAMWSMLQAEAPEDFVIGTGTTHSIEDFASRAFECVGLDWRSHVTSVDHLVRPSDTTGVAADITKAKAILDWSPQVQFERLVSMMVDADVATIENPSLSQNAA